MKFSEYGGEQLALFFPVTRPASSDSGNGSLRVVSQAMSIALPPPLPTANLSTPGRTAHLSKEQPEAHPLGGAPAP